jgi:N6-L-threonylcarbamoyladenine synthase
MNALRIVCGTPKCYSRHVPFAMETTVMTRVTLLGIESSCDDTAAAIVQGVAGIAQVRSSVVTGQTDLHAGFGGVVPEIAARAHAEKLDLCVIQALQDAQMSLNDIDAIAVTAGPGLIGGVVSGVMFAKGISAARGIPLFGINHLAGHALTPRLTDGIAFPYLMVLVSGGHCQFLLVSGPDQFERLGGTIDDAPGEAFDKVARLIGLEQPGGPAIEKCAKAGDPERFKFPRPLLDREGCDMSFSGLKTAVLRQRDSLLVGDTLSRTDQADLAAGFQAAVVDVLAEKTRRALMVHAARADNPTSCVAGGVAANMAIRQKLERLATEAGADFVAPPLALCTDNAAMIAYAAVEQMGTRKPDDMSLSARPRWPLDQHAPAMLGSGKKGAKA